MRARIATTLIIAILLAGATLAPAQQSIREAFEMLDRRIAGIPRIGQVYAIDHHKGRLQVSLGKGTDGSEFLTGWIPWPDYMTPEKGQLALVACPSGNLHLATLVSLLPTAQEQRE